LASWPLVTGLTQDQAAIERLARDLTPRVERAVGLRFRRPPAVASVSRDQLRAYLNHRMAQAYPPAEMRGIERAYHALGIVPDSVDVRRLLLDVLGEQVAGYYDADSSKLFVIRGGDPQLLRITLAHELVHALQDQHTRLSEVLHLKRQNDRATAGQAVFEGQATLAMARTLVPEITPEQLAQQVAAARSGIAAAALSSPALARAPRFVVAALTFPYTEGAGFVLAFEEQRRAPGDQPYGARLPVSTEQILHPLRYAEGDVPVRVGLAAAAPGDTVLYEDDFGEFELKEALIAWGAAEDAATAAAAGWDGDRYRVLGTPAGTVVLLATAWDSEADAADFERRARAAWTTRAARHRDARTRRFEVERLTVGGVPVVRLADAPAAWTGWTRLPAVRIVR
jgi:hypothetical protein